MTNCHEKCVSKYLRNTKKLDVKSIAMYGNPSTYVEKTGPENFLPYAF
jgi:hypothetical protein